MPKITESEMRQLIDSNGHRNPIYQKTIDLYNSLRVHLDGEFPEKIIRDRRPNEAKEILEYRERVYKPITKLPLSKVISSFGKIRRSPDFMIQFPKPENSSVIDEESLETYCTEKIPGFDSIETWIFEVLLRQMLVDPNAVVAVLPVEKIEQAKYTKPVPLIFNSDQVLAYDEVRTWALLRSSSQVSMKDGADTWIERPYYYYVDDSEILIFKPDEKSNYTISERITNHTKKFPAFKVRAVPKKIYEGTTLNISRLDAMVPFLDEAAAEYSDLKGSKIMHLYPLFWYYQDQKCSTCKGIGKTTTTAGEKKCTTCEGTGEVKFSPFSAMKVTPANLGKQAAPTPPAGFVDKDTMILELQEKSVDKHIFRALGAVNMQFLDQTPLSISGDAKQTDREELQNTVYNVAEDLITTSIKAIDLINRWRNGHILDEGKLRALMPSIPVPQNYDLLPENYLTKELTDSKTAGVSPFMISVIEEELAAKKFYSKPELASTVATFYELDPLPGFSMDQKMTALSNNSITNFDFVLSNYLANFIRTAMQKQKNFCDLNPAEKMEILRPLVEKKMKDIEKEKTAAADARAKASGNNKLDVFNQN